MSLRHIPLNQVKNSRKIFMTFTVIIEQAKNLANFLDRMEGKRNAERNNTFGRENPFFMMSAVYQMNVEIPGYGVNSWDLVCPSAI